MNLPNTRVIMRIEVLPDARDGMETVSRERGMTHVAINSRLIDWLAGQPDMIQASVLGLLPAEVALDVPVTFLRQLASQKKP